MNLWVLLKKYPFIAFAIFSVLFFLSVNHFDGFDQDCILYTLQAMNRIFPDRFIDDPAFMFGNQDSFSLFTPVYLIFIKLLPIDTAALVFQILIHSGVAVSFAWLVYKWTKKFDCQKLLLPIVLFFFAVYAHGEFRNEIWNSIKTIEAFPVARTLAVCFGFWGLAHFFDKNKWITLFLFLAGSAFHPLTVGWGLPLWVFYHFPKFRIPVAVLSALLPFTILADKEPFAPFPPDWIRISWDMEGCPELIMNILLNVAFLVFLTFKYLKDPVVKKFTANLAIVVGIGFYWFLAAVATHHILLFQVQTFRVVWLCQAIVVFLQFYALALLYREKICNGIKLDIWDKIIVLFVLALWIDCTFVNALYLFGFLLWHFKDKPAYNKLKVTAFCLWAGLTVYVAYWIFDLSQSPVASFYVSYATIIQEVQGASAALALVVDHVYPRLKPIVFSVLVASVALILEGTQIFPEENFSLAFILIAACVLCSKNRAMWGVLVVCLCVVIVTDYDHRSPELKAQEKAMNQFVEEVPFPYIENRGRILYSVEDYAQANPRIRFLSAAYYDQEYIVGAVFFKGHKYEATNREKMLFMGETPSDSEWYALDWRIRKSKAVEYLLDRDSLIVRTKYLCDKKEITHLITDKIDLPFAKDDSLTLWYKNEKIYLHSCENVLRQ